MWEGNGIYRLIRSVTSSKKVKRFAGNLVWKPSGISKHQKVQYKKNTVVGIVHPIEIFLYIFGDIFRNYFFGLLLIFWHFSFSVRHLSRTLEPLLSLGLWNLMFVCVYPTKYNFFFFWRFCLIKICLEKVNIDWKEI